ncbi:bifunctional 23S rRNA (guanine(2069)-N(7))-methyltransferase RlmK/23S rRNA (guanine(2445)-N(2))-methyltransferase RlmL [Desulfopila inferna]|uniref:bifunctional 23S rRNA (guanine(2069)-N(7))-methyltransferase RlmK/23S rRNA (guanine(2445)-N(2))-methyltransferase RlmL n=1 Tax=Desulfopila inferna TaxID=468528 RepID=UPI001962C4C9|nr:bifunctional 23S rRNA (guanine(2069)-N(7))-methyltransferase RlmK/23S rRNA (guanine(2445)-N(2))-methyltransferase RlmL [Desulfopila inferna]MBM9603931.1 bifunctional 23S rRNA (guanine(2069)-N(7))-methyltransferase RlmK/23S rRNA (guanine(2445)-N(2))-methyltransferase RlmL [Desulfopila inferna]
MAGDFKFIAGCAAGIEGLAGEEITSFGGTGVDVAVGVVGWRGTLETAYRACLWSRYASRVLLEIHSLSIDDGDDLYSQCRNIDWSAHLDNSMTFAVSSTLGKNAVIPHSHYAALRVKDAVVDFFRDTCGDRPNISRDKPDLKIHLHVHENTAQLYIDLGGESLHRRGYRETGGVAPLKETLAAAIVALSGWNSGVSSRTTFLDPMCGSGTLLIEAALLWSDSAPGLSRTYFGFNKWRGHNDVLWTDLVNEAVAVEEKSFAGKWPRIIGYDSDPAVVATARKNIAKAGLEDKIEVHCKDVAFLRPPSDEGFFVSNLPYGERLSEKEEVRFLYNCVGRILRDLFKNWRAGIFISDPDVADQFNIDIESNYRLFNGPISCRLLVGKVISDEAPPFHWQIKDDTEVEEGSDFANRLKKNFKKISNWASNNSISCFRVYDRDLPEYNVAIDIYEKWILVQEYMPPASIDADLAKKRFSNVLSSLRHIFQIRRDRIFLKQRRRQRGKSQYQKREIKIRYHQVREGECYFLVNFQNYLDTGLFLDHRPLRAKIAELANGKRFLNLFGYTGAATVHAAKGGAALTTTVDLSGTYLEWARKNLALNGLSLKRHETIKQDCLSWLREAHGEYDLIYIDPPTFSNTKKKNLVFDVQRSHAELIDRASRLLTEHGVILFSTNYKGFKMDRQILTDFVLGDISKETIPFDFQRNRSIHSCWKIIKKR